VIHRKSTPKDPNFLEISAACGKIEQFIESVFPSSTTPTIAQQKLDAERAENAMTPEQKRELNKIYAAIIAFWIVLVGIMMFIAWLFGARFDLMFGDLMGMWRLMFGNSAEEPVGIRDEL
jgi:farnesyl-diphosphate farnesyltransferase